MIFTSEGNFIQEVKFNNDDMDEESSDEEIDKLSEGEMVEIPANE